MQFTQTTIAGVRLIELEKRQDDRGYFARSWCTDEFAKQGLPSFVQTNMSGCVYKGTIRGLHYQAAPHGEAKFMRCIRGAIYDVALDLRPESATFGKWFAAELTADNKRAIFVPEGLAHAYQALTPDCEVIYSSSCAYTPGAERGVRWNDPAFNIHWPIADPVLSDKDKKWPDFDLAGDNAPKHIVSNSPVRTLEGSRR